MIMVWIHKNLKSMHVSHIHLNCMFNEISLFSKVFHQNGLTHCIKSCMLMSNTVLTKVNYSDLQEL